MIDLNKLLDGDVDLDAEKIGIGLHTSDGKLSISPAALEDVIQKQKIAIGLQEELNQAETAAIDSLARYKFLMFGYWAGIWVHLNRIGRFKNNNPFRDLVMKARQMRDGAEFDAWDPWEGVVRSHKDFQQSTYTGGINELGVSLKDGTGEANFHGPDAWTQAAHFLGFNICPGESDWTGREIPGTSHAAGYPE